MLKKVFSSHVVSFTTCAPDSCSSSLTKYSCERSRYWVSVQRMVELRVIFEPSDMETFSTRHVERWGCYNCFQFSRMCFIEKDASVKWQTVSFKRSNRRHICWRNDLYFLFWKDFRTATAATSTNFGNSNKLSQSFFCDHCTSTKDKEEKIRQNCPFLMSRAYLCTVWSWWNESGLPEPPDTVLSSLTERTLI